MILSIYQILKKKISMKYDKEDEDKFKLKIIVELFKQKDKENKVLRKV